MSENLNEAHLASFDHFVSKLKPRLKRQYDRGVNRDLSQQHWQGLFKRNVTAVLKQVYDDSLTQLKQLPFETDAKVEISTMTGQVLQSFEGVIDELMQYALQKHRTSCALSNFPDEHRPSQDYIVEVLQETAIDWQDFADQVNKVFSIETASD